MEDLRKQWHARMGKLDTELRRELRKSYEVRAILDELAERAGTVTSRHELASVLEKIIADALNPRTFACYFQQEDSLVVASSETVSGSLQSISTTSPILAFLARRGRTSNVSELGGELELATISALGAECLVPILGRKGRLVGTFILGPRADGEPYSRQDTDLLDSIANHVASVVENICLAELMAERMESEGRIRQEIEFAKQVQARLFPQKLPQLRTLEYAGCCIQARQVGGDYYDFLEMTPGRMAFVLADVAGKGLAGALLMANLQANLRSQYAIALDNPRALLASVNRLFYENTDENSYATLFFADYDDTSRRFRYVNCGHLPPLLLRGTPGNGGEEPIVERLAATGTVLGLFKDWQCELGEVYLSCGDIVVIYSDGATEATDENQAEFGESGLLAALDRHRDLPTQSLLEAVVDRVQRYQHGAQADDITLVIARCRA